MVNRAEIITNSMQEIIHDIVDYFTTNMNNTVQKIILYGSYARGEQSDESDLDVLVLVDTSDFEYIRESRWIVSQLLLDKYFILGSFIIENIDVFNTYKDVSLFYSNILREGKVIYGSNTN